MSRARQHVRSFIRQLSTGTSTSTTSSTPFIPRQEFPVPGSIINSYFLGHHRQGLTKMKQLVSSVELVLECRDYRVPLSSRNPLFEETLQGRERLIVYTKRDLAEGELDTKTMDTIRDWHRPNHVMFTATNQRKDIKKIVNYTKDVAKNANSVTGIRILVVGMPNVGKSSLLNALRGVGTGNYTKAAITGGQPGVTRKLSTGVKISEEPLIYLIDSPGVFVPYLPNAHTMLKLAIVGCIKDSLIPSITLADYLLYHINLRDPNVYSKFNPPTNDITEFLTSVAKKTGRLFKGGHPDLEASAVWVVNRYRAGLLGKFILDPVDKDAYAKWLEEENSWGESQTAVKRRTIKDRKMKGKSKKTVSVEGATGGE